MCSCAVSLNKNINRQSSLNEKNNCLFVPSPKCFPSWLTVQVVILTSTQHCPCESLCECILRNIHSNRNNTTVILRLVQLSFCPLTCWKPTRIMCIHTAGLSSTMPWLYVLYHRYSVCTLLIFTTITSRALCNVYTANNLQCNLAVSKSLNRMFMLDLLLLT